jgi:hypothetical protein
MPIRTKCRAKPRDRAQPTEDTGLSASLAEDPEACWTNRKRRKTPVKQIVFDGQPFTALNVQRMRDRLITRTR